MARFVERGESFLQPAIQIGTPFPAVSLGLGNVVSYSHPSSSPPIFTNPINGYIASTSKNPARTETRPISQAAKVFTYASQSYADALKGFPPLTHSVVAQDSREEVLTRGKGVCHLEAIVRPQKLRIEGKIFIFTPSKFNRKLCITEIQRKRKLNIWLGFDLCVWLLNSLQTFTEEGYLRSNLRREENRRISLTFLPSRNSNHLKLCEHHQDGKVWICIPEGNQGNGLTSFTSFFRNAFDSLKLSIPPPPPFLDRAVVCFTTPDPPLLSSYSISSHLLSLDIPGYFAQTPTQFSHTTLTALISHEEPKQLAAAHPAPSVHIPLTSLSPIAQPFIPRAKDCAQQKVITSKLPHFLGCSNSDNYLENSEWSKNLSYNSGSDRQVMSKSYNPLLDASEDEWVTDRGSEDDLDWHARKEASMKRNQRKFEHLCSQFKDSPKQRRSKRLSNLKSSLTQEKGLL